MGLEGRGLPSTSFHPEEVNLTKSSSVLSPVFDNNDNNNDKVVNIEKTEGEI